jgi:hypothetical protein
MTMKNFLPIQLQKNSFFTAEHVVGEVGIGR